MRSAKDPFTVAIDIETDGKEWYETQPHWLGWATSEGKVHSGPCTPKEIERVMDWQCDPNVTVVFHNGKFDLQVLDHVYGGSVRYLLAKYHDTFPMFFLLDERGKHRLADLARRYLNADLTDKFAIEQWLHEHRRSFRIKHGRDPNFSDAPDELNYRRNKWDVIHTLKLFNLGIGPVLRDFPELYQNELDLLLLAAEMETRGVYIDLKRTRRLRKEAREDIQWVQEKIAKVVGRPVIVQGTGSRKELFQVIRKDFKWPIAVYTEKGNPRFDEYGLLQYVDEKAHHLIKWESEDLSIRRYYKALRKTLPDRRQIYVPLLLKYRELNKMISTYYNNFLSMAVCVKGKNQSRGVVHAKFNSVKAITGRFSSSEPNLQNVPRKLGPRQCFLARPGYINYHFDYSQIEIRLLIHYARDEELRDLVESGGDIHMTTAMALFEKKAKDISPEERKKAKTINFGIIYGAGSRKVAFTLTAKLGLPTTEGEAKSFIRRYFSRYPTVVNTMGKFKALVLRQHQLKSEYGRVFHIPSDKAYKGLNAIIQGCAADIMKFALIRIWKFLRKTEAKSNIIMTIHDEIVLEIHESEEEWLVPKVKKLMEKDSPRFFCPIRVEIEKTAGYWSDKEKVDA